MEMFQYRCCCIYRRSVSSPSGKCSRGRPRLRSVSIECVHFS